MMDLKEVNAKPVQVAMYWDDEIWVSEHETKKLKCF